MNSIRVNEKPKGKALTNNWIKEFCLIPYRTYNMFLQNTCMIRIYDNECDKRLTAGLNLSFKNKMKKE